MKKGIYILILIVIAGIIVWSNGRTDTQEENITIGVIVPLTGQYASFGESVKNAMLLAQEKNKSSHTYVFEDDAYDAKKAVTAYHKLTDIDGADVVVAWGAPSIQALKPLTDTDSIPLLGLGTVMVYENDSVFQLMPLGDTIFPKLGEIYGEKYSNIVVAHSSAALFADNAEDFIAGLPESVTHESVVIGAATDYRTEVQKIIQKKPQAVTAFMQKEDALIFLKELRTQDPSASIVYVCDFGTEIASQEYTEALGQERLEGCISTNIGDSMRDEFKGMYAEKYATDPLITADYAFDVDQLVTNLADKSVSEKWIDALDDPDFSYTGFASGQITFTDDGARKGIEPTVSVYKNGTFEKVQ